VALARGGHALAYVLNELDAGHLFTDRALTLNPSLANAWFSSAWLHVWIGEPESALQRAAQAIRLSPRDPFLPSIRSAAAFAHFFAGRYDDAAAMAESVLQERPEFHQALRAAAASYALAGKHDAAQKVMTRLRQIDPGLRVANLGMITPLRRVEDRVKYAKAMEGAGLPP